MIKKIIISVLFLVVNFTYAQQSTSSLYSIHGLGIQNFRGSIANRSIGGLSLYSDSSSPNIQNPASYGDLERTSFGIGGTYSVANFESDEGSSKGISTSLDYLSISLPAGKFGFGFGLLPYRSLGFSFSGKRLGVREQSKGKGNINRAYLGAGVELFKGFKLGADFQYNFGRLENEVTQLPESQNNIRVITQSDVSGISYTFSGIYDYDITEDLFWRASIIYSKSSKITSKNSQQFSAVSETIQGLILTSSSEAVKIDDRTFDLPSRFTFGGAFVKKNKWFLGSELYFGDNRNFQDRSEDRGVRFTDPFGFKIGGYITPKYNSLTSYFEKATYRLGVRFEKLGLEIRGEEIDEFGTSFGISLPVSKGYSTMDIGFEFGVRGKKSANLVEENFINISLGLSLSDKWFRKRKFN